MRYAEVVVHAPVSRRLSPAKPPPFPSPATRAQVLRYAASGDITGDKRPGTYTVGHLAAAFVREKPQE